jgi:hypothetical protein
MMFRHRRFAAHCTCRSVSSVASETSPYLDHLEDAVTIKDGVPHFIPIRGQKVIIERFASVLTTRPWLDTRTYTVIAVDEANGNLKLLDDVGQQCSSNYKSGIEYGYRFKLPEGSAPLPRKNKAAPKVSAAEKAKVKAEKASGDKLRRVYTSKNVIHTRIKGVAYVPPQGTTQAQDGMRLETKVVGTNLKVKHPELGWEETWTINKDM